MSEEFRQALVHFVSGYTLTFTISVSVYKSWRRSKSRTIQKDVDRCNIVASSGFSNLESNTNGLDRKFNGY